MPLNWTIFTRIYRIPRPSDGIFLSFRRTKSWNLTFYTRTFNRTPGQINFSSIEDILANELLKFITIKRNISHKTWWDLFVNKENDFFIWKDKEEQEENFNNNHFIRCFKRNSIAWSFIDIYPFVCFLHLSEMNRKKN